MFIEATYHKVLFLLYQLKFHHKVLFLFKQLDIHRKVLLQQLNFLRKMVHNMSILSNSFIVKCYVYCSSLLFIVKCLFIAVLC